MLEYASLTFAETSPFCGVSDREQDIRQRQERNTPVLASMIKTPGEKAHLRNEQTQLRNERDEQTWSTLMTEALQGNEASYRTLLSSLAKAIESYLRANFGNLEFLEDCVQECLLSIHQGRHTYDPHRPFRPWMFTIVRHKAIDMLRHRGRRPETYSVDDEESSLAIERLADTASADELSTHDEVFGDLAPTFREALVLTKVIGLSMREAAEKLGVSEPAMKVRVHRAIGALKKQLETY